MVSDGDNDTGFFTDRASKNRATLDFFIRDFIIIALVGYFFCCVTRELGIYPRELEEDDEPLFTEPETAESDE